MGGEMMIWDVLGFPMMMSYDDVLGFPMMMSYDFL